MLYAIHQGAVDSYGEGQQEVLHLVGSIEGIARAGFRFAFTDGHAVMALSQFYEDLNDLSVIDQTLMKRRYWYDTDQEPDRKRRRQAEFLVHRFVPLPCLLEIGVMTDIVAYKVQEILGPNSVLKVNVKRDWYY
jgi:ssDNA thymidine ADP-ribosyltransferase DarT-like protein